MKTIITFIFTACLISGAMAQLNYHRVGGIYGEPDPFMVVGVDLFEMHPNTQLYAEAVTFTAFNANTAYAGIGVRKDWQMATYSVSGGIALVAPLGAGWTRIDDLRMGMSIGVKF